MNEIPPPPPAPPPVPGRPFTGEPRALPTGGCSRPVLVGCGAVIVLLGIAGIVFVAKAKDILAYAMRELHEQVTSALPAEVTAAERRRLDRGFDAALERINAGQVEPPALYALQRQLMSAAEKSQSKSLTHDDVLDLLSALERVGGLLPDDGGDVAAPEPDDAAPADGGP
jgi:hypothetical protein